MTGNPMTNAAASETRRPKTGIPRDPAGGRDGGARANSKPIGAVRCFWWTIVTLICVTLVLSIMAAVNQSRASDAPFLLLPDPPVTDGDGEPADPPAGCLTAEDLRRRAERRAGPLLEHLLRRPFPATEEAIRNHIDSAFEPVYEQIPAFLDWHYSIVGQYTQLGMAAVGRLQQEMESRLFTGMPDRMRQAAAAINLVMETELRDSIAQWLRNEGQTVNPECEAGIAYADMLNEVVPDSIQRFRASVAPSGAAALGAAAGGKAAVTAVAKGMGKKLAASASIKTAGKTVTKVLGTGGAAAVGTAAGAVLGPFGAMIGAGVGIAAGAAGWLTIDGVVVGADEYFNRDDLERELTELVDTQKAEVAESISTRFEEARSEALENATPSQL